MPSTQYEARRLYSLHVFKDNAGSNWTNPTIHVFPLSGKSAHKFGGRSSSGRYAGTGPKGYPGSRDGLVNLYRLPSDQLSFLQHYVGKLNTEVEEQKEKLAEDWKASIQQEEKENFEKEMKRNEEQMNLLNLKRQYLKEKRQDGETSAEKQTQGERGPRKTVPRNSGRCRNRYESDSDSTAREAPEVYSDPVAHRYRGRLGPRRPHRSSGPTSSPATFETSWTIEEVELSFIPERINLVAPYSTNSQLSLQTFRLAEPGETQEMRRETRLEVATNVIAPESFSSFAVVLSRCRGVERPRGNPVAYQREYSPTRSYLSDSPSQFEAEEEELAVGVEKLDPNFPGFGPPPIWNTTVGAPVPYNAAQERKGSEVPSEAGKNEDAFETESKTGEEGEGCGEGTVYIKVVKRAE